MRNALLGPHIYTQREKTCTIHTKYATHTHAHARWEPQNNNRTRKAVGETPQELQSSPRRLSVCQRVHSACVVCPCTPQQTSIVPWRSSCVLLPQAITVHANYPVLGAPTQPHTHTEDRLGLTYRGQTDAAASWHSRSASWHHTGMHTHIHIHITHTHTHTHTHETDTRRSKEQRDYYRLCDMACVTGVSVALRLKGTGK